MVTDKNPSSKDIDGFEKFLIVFLIACCGLSIIIL